MVLSETPKTFYSPMEVPNMYRVLNVEDFSIENGLMVFMPTLLYSLGYITSLAPKYKHSFY